MDVTCTEKSSGDANCDNIPKTIEEEDLKKPTFDLICVNC